MGPAVAAAQQGRFDLLGPSIDVHVTRGTQSLPIASVPNLLPGDKLLVHADLPQSQSVHLLLVVAFLRGTTNPPPDNWFTRVETWNRKNRSEGVTVIVPDEAQQALIFIAPETGGDFSTLKSAVRGRPGTFVRAAQDLNEASFEQSRIERYVQALAQVPPGSPAELLDHSRKLAATLNLKPNDDCFKRPPADQLSCLRQTGSQLLLDDGHGQTLAQMLSTGASADLIGNVAGTPVANVGGAAAYSAYVGTVLDLVRLMTGLHTAKFQYIPAIAFPNGDALNLRLNTPPSFHDPKSVIVIGLPAIQKATLPPLQLQNARHVSCLLQPRMVLPLNGAPLVFATGFAHDIVLHLDAPGPDGRTDIPLAPDAYEGGLIVTEASERKLLAAAAPPARDQPAAAPSQNATAPSQSSATPSQPTPPPLGSVILSAAKDLNARTAATPSAAPNAPAAATAGTTLPANAPTEIQGTVRGFWGFDSFSGPTVPLQQLPGKDWRASSDAELFTGRSNQVRLVSDGVACVSTLTLSTAADGTPLEAHRDDNAGPHVLSIRLPLEKSAPGKLGILVHQYGASAPTRVDITAYADVARPQELRIHAGDRFATLTGSGLNEVRTVSIDNLVYTPAPDSGTDGKVLRLALAKDQPSAAAGTASAKSGSAGETAKTRKSFAEGDHGSAIISLNDGRSLPIAYAVDASRPAVTLLSKTITAAHTDGLPLTLTNPDAIPAGAKLTFAIRSDSPQKFSRKATVEIATTDGSLHTAVSMADGSLVLQDSRTALAFLHPGKAFGASAFGDLQFRIVVDGLSSDWLPLGTLVRTPVLHSFTCPAGSAAINSAAGHASAMQAANQAVAATQTAATAQAAAATQTAAAIQTSGATQSAASASTQSAASAAAPGTAPAAAPPTPCTLTGTELFLIDATAGDAAFRAPIANPPGNAAETLNTERPTDGRTLYLRLRDDPDHTVTVPVETKSAAKRGQPLTSAE